MIAERTLVKTHSPGIVRRIEEIMWDEGFMAFSPDDVRMIQFNLYRIYGDHREVYTHGQILTEIYTFYNS